MSIEIEKVAQLARMNLKADEKNQLMGDLEKILDYIRTLEKIDTREVPATSHVLGIQNVFRKDEPRPWKGLKKLLEKAPSKEETFFKVPKVVDRS